MVDVAGGVATPCGVHYSVVINAEHVDAAVGSFVVSFPLVGDLIADESTDVLYDHGVLLNIMSSIQPQALFKKVEMDNGVNRCCRRSDI